MKDLIIVILTIVVTITFRQLTIRFDNPIKKYIRKQVINYLKELQNGNNN